MQFVEPVLQVFENHGLLANPSRNYFPPTDRAGAGDRAFPT